jgi:hypothetical protein
MPRSCRSRPGSLPRRAIPWCCRRTHAPAAGPRLIRRRHPHQRLRRTYGRGSLAAVGRLGGQVGVRYLSQGAHQVDGLAGGAAALECDACQLHVAEQRVSTRRAGRQRPKNGGAGAPAGWEREW